MKKIVTVLFMLMFVSSALAVELPFNQLEGTAVPGVADSGIAKSLIGNQRANVYMALPDGSSQEIGIIMEQGVITSVQTIALTEPTLNVYADQATIQQLLSSNNPRKDLKQALDEERLTYTALGLGNKVKFGMAVAALSVAGIFGGDDEITGAVIVENNQVMEDKSEDLMDSMEKPEAKEDEEVEAMDNQDSDEQEEIETEDTAKENKKSETHIIQLTGKGFEPDFLEISTGDTVVWENIRERHPISAMIIGVRECKDVRSDIFGPGQEFHWTFDEPMRCTIAGGVYTTHESKIIVN